MPQGDEEDFVFRNVRAVDHPGIFRRGGETQDGLEGVRAGSPKCAARRVESFRGFERERRTEADRDALKFG